ncbi:hypothetical protein AB0C01_21330 [Micromonospora sp. NPDC048905]|uniref:hypothetical protein n=1 Tax=Micromonospora sp. NPDC048905 TaxID=3155494 RepID=UPI0033F7469A
MSAPNDREFVERFAEVTGGRRPTGYVEGWEAYVPAWRNRRTRVDLALSVACLRGMPLMPRQKVQDRGNGVARDPDITALNHPSGPTRVTGVGSGA